MESIFGVKAVVFSRFVHFYVTKSRNFLSQIPNHLHQNNKLTWIYQGLSMKIEQNALTSRFFSD